MAAESQFAQLYGASSHNVRLTNDETVSEPLLTSSTFHAQTHTADQPLETDFPAHVDLSLRTDLGQAPALETRVELPLETNFGSHHSVASSLSQAPADLYQYKISYEMTPYSSTLSSLHPVCRICQNPSEKRNVLITPCRCDGTLKHVHGTCLRVMSFKSLILEFVLYIGTELLDDMIMLLVQHSQTWPYLAESPDTQGYAFENILCR